MAGELNQPQFYASEMPFAPSGQVTILDPRMASTLIAPKSHNVQVHSQLMKLFRVDMAARQQYEPGWMMNLLFWAGRHWIWWDANVQAFMVGLPQDHRVLAVINRYRRVLQKRVNRYIRYMPDLGVLAGNGDTKAKSEAKRAEQLLRYIRRAAGYSSATRKAIHWNVICGTGGLRPYWDDGAGPPALQEQYDSAGNLIIDEKCRSCGGSGMEGGEQVQSTLGGVAGIFSLFCPECAGLGGKPRVKEGPTGDPRLKVVSPFDQFPAAGFEYQEQVERFTEREVMSVQELGRRWKHMREFYTKGDDGILSYSLGFGTVFPTLNLATHMGPTLGYNQMKDMVSVYRMYCRPTSDFPNGHVYVFTDKWLIEHYDYEYPELAKVTGAYYPHTIFTESWSPGFFGQSYGDDMRDLNAIVNDMLSGFVEYMRLVRETPLLAEVGSMVNEQPPIKPGRVYEYSRHLGADKPEYLPPPIMPEAMFKIFGAAMDAESDVALEQREGTEIPESGRQEALLQDRINKDNTYHLEEFAAKCMQLGQALLYITELNMKEGREFAVLGESQQPQFFKIEPSDAIDVRELYVTDRALLPDNRSELIDVVTEKIAPFMVDKSTGGVDTRRVLDLLKMGGGELDNDHIHHDNALRENEQMKATGQPSPIRMYEDQRLHMQDHEVALALEPDPNSPGALAITAHMQMHEQRIAQMAMQQVMMSQQQIASGQAPATGPAAGDTQGDQTPLAGQSPVGPGGLGPAGAPPQMNAPTAGGAIRQADQRGRAAAHK